MEPRADFLMLGACCFSTARLRSSGIGRCRDTDTPGRYPYLHSQKSPQKFPIFQEDSQFKLYLLRFRYTNHMEKLAKGRIVAFLGFPYIS